jgi:hypothetical protein
VPCNAINSPKVREEQINGDGRVHEGFSFEHPEIHDAKLRPMSPIPEYTSYQNIFSPKSCIVDQRQGFVLIEKLMHFQSRGAGTDF